MKRQWEPEELAEQWTLHPTDLALLANRAGATRLGVVALLLHFYQLTTLLQHVYSACHLSRPFPFCLMLVIIVGSL